ncbi:hypothetical protein [Priestia aryabhattai]|uniref:hypothetical protein n=1 Tax=Priestia aryabhattai TaxID=412384 RepID=UPI001ADA4290|nr:hypothetical protein [Priestia aryabhattai]QTL52844.1 hypothetical protein J5Z55_30940 [Priestia aryabhattai]
MRKTKGFTFRNIFRHSPKISLTRPRLFKAYSFVPFSPFAMLDSNILILGGIVLGIAIVERILERWGVIDLVDQFSKVMCFILPVTFYSALIYFFATFMF